MNKYYKIIGTNVLIVLLSWQFFKYVDYVLNVITPESFRFDFAALGASLAYWREPMVVISFIVLVSIISLALAIFRNKRWELVTSGIVGLIFFLHFGFNYINLLGVLITISLFEYARHRGVEEIDQRTKINPWMIVRRNASGVVLAFFVLISFAAYQSSVAEGIAQAEQLPSASQQMIRSIVDSIVGSQIPAGPEKESAITQVTSQTFHQINSILKPYFRYAPPLLAFGLFLILWGLSWVFVWLSVLVGMGIFWLLRKTGFVKIEKHNIEAERLTV